MRDIVLSKGAMALDVFEMQQAQPCEIAFERFAWPGVGGFSSAYQSEQPADQKRYLASDVPEAAENCSII
ncbi:hypothetical protein [Sabulicella rubraurantiaca]|uniref:hypothetical protein n=1 Tax=Sabulicella rubraurantiaca TaxID=2811429 RepID=UPI001A96A891|nr:hypothetical protein [Sabulicella rubraurantiaca]